MPDNNDNLPVTRAELKEVLAEFADRIISYVEPRFKEINHRFDELQGQMAELRNRLEKVETELVELRKQQGRVEVELGTLRAQIVSLEDRLKHVETGLERMVLTLFKFENRDDIRTERIANLIEDLKKVNGRFILIQSEVAEFKSQYSMERVQAEMEEFRRTTRRLEERVTWLEKNRAGASA